MGLFRRQKDLLSRQREELGLDRPFESPKARYSSEPTEPPEVVDGPPFEGARFEPQRSYAGGFTISSGRPASGWRRIVTIPRVFLVTFAVAWWGLHRLGLASGAALIAAFALAMVAATRLGRSRVRIQAVRGAPRSDDQPPA